MFFRDTFVLFKNVFIIPCSMICNNSLFQIPCIYNTLMNSNPFFFKKMQYSNPY